MPHKGDQSRQFRCANISLNKLPKQYMTIEFAVDPANPEVADQIINMIRPNLDWFALLDTAFDHEKPGFSLPSDAVNCFQGIIFLDDLNGVAPVLIPLPLELAPERVPDLIKHRGNRPMLSFLGVEKGVSAADLAEQWETLHWLSPEEGKPYLLRMADTRTLPILPKILDTEQWQAIHQNIVEWHIISRRGKLEGIPLEKTDKRLPSKLEITEKRFAQIVELNEPDAMLSAINNRNSKAIPKDMTGYRFYNLASQMLGRTARYDITHWGDKVSLVILAVGTNGEVLDDPEVDAWMKAKEWEEGEAGTAAGSAPCFARWK